MKKVELLAPAGSLEGFYGVINAGADAVYMAGNRFGARAYADNFSEEELIQCLQYAHLHHVKIYLTVNTLTKEFEIAELVEFLEPLYENGLDGIIVQDLGVCKLARELFPGLEVHGSTQMNITTPEGALVLKENGLTRVVPARELSLKEVRELKDTAGLEVECFIHGAMCYSYSGQCLFSSLLGGRSGNRGRCAQPCRLPYHLKGQNAELYPISLKDMCLLDYIPELIEAGIDSFKIEGRMKKPEYAAGVTAIYRKYIDLCEAGRGQFHVSNEDRRHLESLYIRSNQNTGYYFKHNGKDMITMSSPGYNGADEQFLNSIHNTYLSTKKKIRVSMKASLQVDEPISLSLRVEDKEPVIVYGAVVAVAQKQPVSEDNIRKQLSKTGDTCFEIENIEIHLQGNCFISLKAINELRREGLQLLENMLLSSYMRSSSTSNLKNPDITQEKTDAALDRTEGCLKRSDYILMKPDTDIKRSVSSLDKSKAGLNYTLSFATTEQAAAYLELCRAHDCVPLAERVYVSSSILENRAFFEELRALQGEGVYLNLPHIYRGDCKKYYERLWGLIEELNIAGVLVHHIDHIGFLLQHQYRGCMVGDSSLYLWNSKAQEFVLPYISQGTLPLELNQKESLHLLKHTSLPMEKLVYGYIPMMYSANCVVKTLKQCSRGNGAKQGLHYEAQTLELLDRYQNSFYAVTDCNVCMNTLYNTVPMSLHNCKLRLYEEYPVSLRLQFSLEKHGDTKSILSYYLEGNGAGEFPIKEYTTGHEKRGVM